MRRRAFLALLGTAVACPAIVAAQQGGSVRRIGVLVALPEGDRDGEARMGAFRDELQKLGWTAGRKLSCCWHEPTKSSNEVKRAYYSGQPRRISVGFALASDEIE
jgi:hypothetical protein